MYLILIVLILGAVIYRGLSSYYAQKLIQSGLQRGYDWYEKTGHQLMDPSAFTIVEKQRQLAETEAEGFWNKGKEIEVKSHDGLNY